MARGRLSGQERADEFAVDVGEAVVASLELEGQAFVIEAEQVEQGGVDVVDMGGLIDGIESEFVGFADDLSAAHAAAGEPHGEGIDVMVSAGAVAGFAHGGATEFAAPDDEGGVKETAGFEVADEGGAALIGFAATGGKILFEILSGAAVGIPVGVVELDEAGAAFDEAAGEKTVPGEGRLLAGATVEVEGGVGFVGEIHEFRRTGLHAIGHLVGADAGEDLGIPGGGLVPEVEIAEGVEGAALARGVDSLGVGEVEDGIALIAEGNALMGGGEETGTPVDGAAAGSAGSALEHDEAGEIAGFGADPVGDPGTDAGPAELAAAGVHEQLGWRVVEQRGLAGTDDGEVIDDAGGVGKEIAHPGAGLAVLTEGAFGSEEGGAVLEGRIHEGEPFAFNERIRDRLPVQVHQPRFPVEQLQLRWATGHEEEDDRFGAGRMMPGPDVGIGGGGSGCEGVGIEQ